MDSNNMSTNLFNESKITTSSDEILEGFLCPICHEDLKSVEFLTEHFSRSHSDEQDALGSIFKDIFTKAKKKMRLNFDDSSDLSRNFERNAVINEGLLGATALHDGTNGRQLSNVRTPNNVYNFMNYQEVGVVRSHLEYFESIRSPRLERYACETNKLIIRLHKLLKDMPSDPVLRKQHEQNTVTWLNGSSVKLCPNCAKKFHLGRRQHHCRVCGSIMCNDCSRYLPLETAHNLASLTMNHDDDVKQQQQMSNSQKNTLRTCTHCLRLLEVRHNMHESRGCRPPVTQIYADIQQLRTSVAPDIEMYLKIVASLYDGESIFTISDASALRGKIGQIAEAIDIKSKRILLLPCEQGTRTSSMHKSIRLLCVQLIKESMLSLPPLPDEETIKNIQTQKRIETEQRIALERKQTMEAYQRYGLANSSQQFNGFNENSTHIQNSHLRSLDNWSAHQVSTASFGQIDDPLIEQINIIKGYIKQARQELNFDVVETLEINLRELQREYYEKQCAKDLLETIPNQTETNDK